jgi:hypothetical protein
MLASAELYNENSRVINVPDTTLLFLYYSILHYLVLYGRLTIDTVSCTEHQVWYLTLPTTTLLADTTVYYGTVVLSTHSSALKEQQKETMANRQTTQPTAFAF